MYTYFFKLIILIFDLFWVRITAGKGYTAGFAAYRENYGSVSTHTHTRHGYGFGGYGYGVGKPDPQVTRAQP